MPIQWSDAYKTGDQQVDDQHCRLFDFVNNLEYILENATNENFDNRRMERLLEFLESYANEHFEYEEGCMFRHQCPLAEKNKEAHEQLRVFMAGFKKKYQTEGASIELFQELHTALSNWLVDHIIKVDLALKACMPQIYKPDRQIVRDR